MAEIFKFFNSAPGDRRVYQAADFANYFGSVLSTGFLHTDNVPGMEVRVETGTLNTIVSPGKAIMKGYAYENTADLTLTHSIPEVSADRIDRIVLRLDLRNSERSIKLAVKEGTSAGTPQAPELQRDNFIYELSLAQILVRKNTAQLLADDLKDERLLESVGGLVYSLISIPTDQFQRQWDEFIKGVQNEGFATVQALNNHANNLAHVHWLGPISGTNVLAASNADILQYVRGLGVSFAATNSSTGATSLNINGFGARPILNARGNPVSNLVKDGIYTLRYSTAKTAFILQGEGGEYGTAGPNDVRAGKTVVTESGTVPGALITRSTTTVTAGPNIQYLEAGIYDNRVTVNPGAPFATGVLNSSISSASFVQASGSGNNIDKYYLQVTGLTFTAKTILIVDTLVNDTLSYVLFNPELKVNGFNNGNIVEQYYSNSPNGFQLTGFAFVNSAGFRMPVSFGNRPYRWYAYG